jgi:hypothetical protein
MTAKDDAENKEIADLVATRAATRGEESVELDEAAAQVLDDAELLEFVREDGESIHDLVVRIGRYQSTLRRIAAPRRPDGTYNLGREACERIAREALGQQDVNAEGSG